MSPAEVPASRVSASSVSFAEPSSVKAPSVDVDYAPIRPRPVSTRLLRSELAMLFRRRRNQAILAALAAIPIVIAVAVKLTNHTGRGGQGNIGGIFGNITDNGVFVAFAALFVVLTLFLPMAVSVVSGESVAGEA